MIYFLLFLLVEVLITSEIISAIGGLNFFFEILLTGIIGIIILVNFRFAIIENIHAFSQGLIAYEEMVARGIFSLIGAVLLIIPGIFTDTLGFAMQFTFLSTLIAKSWVRKYPPRHQSNHYSKHSKGDPDHVIDVEILEDDSHSDDTRRIR